MCNKFSSTGVTLYGVHNKYKLCRPCMLAHRQEYVLTHSYHQSEQHKSKQIRQYLQKELDRKLDKYLLGVDYGTE